MSAYRKKPVVIEAVRFHKDTPDQVVIDFLRDAEWNSAGDQEGPAIAIHTLEGTMKARLGDWIIKGVKGEYYPCKPDIFEETYEPVEAEDVKDCEPQLGCATTGQLLRELEARAELGGYASYRTVDPK